LEKPPKIPTEVKKPDFNAVDEIKGLFRESNLEPPRKDLSQLLATNIEQLRKKIKAKKLKQQKNIKS
jgi:hypothetical protein